MPANARRAGRIDANQPLIVRALRQAGCSVLSLANIGHGCPDLLVGKDGVNWLFEIKDPTQKPSKRRLTDDEAEFFAAWAGKVVVIETVEEALNWVEHGKAVCG